ncbi:hypothetical protein Tco_0959995 [Tanacetum coccineum]
MEQRYENYVEGFENGADMNLTNNGMSLNPPDNLGFISFPAVENDARYLEVIAANKELCVCIGELRRREFVNDIYCYELQNLALSRNDEISSYMNEIDHLRSEQRALMTEIRVLDEEVERVRHGRRRH